VTPVVLTFPTPQCAGRPGWVPYIVQRGDTLFSIARRSGVSVAEIQQANCIPDPNTIYYGQVLIVPPGSAAAATPVGGTAVAASIGCDNPAARITSPKPGTALHGVFTVTGTATLPNFSFYKLEVRPDNGSIWNNFANSTQPVMEGVLGTLDTGLFPPGLYWLQLTVVDITGNFPITPCAVRVSFG
jgi:murein DD-endopeptidase MepM/ murein hydrolase activator NlpD